MIQMLLVAIGMLVSLSSGQVPANRIAADREVLRHYYRVFSDSCYVAPIELQAETLWVAEEIYQATDGWPQTTDEDLVRVVPKIAAHYEQLKSLYPTYVVTLTDEGVDWDEEASSLRLAKGLPAVILIDVTNHTSEDASLAALIAESAMGPSGVVGIERGRSLPILLPLQVDRIGLNAVTLTFAPTENGGEVKSISIPAEIVEPAVLKGTTLDMATGEPFPSRVYVSGPDGILRLSDEVAGNTTLTEKVVVFRPAMQRVPFSYTNGHFTVRVPPGDIKVVLERGYETPIVTETVRLEPGETSEISIASQRAFDMKERGWISGDTHIHWAKNSWDENEELELLAMVQRAEDLRVANNLTLYQWRPEGSFLKPDQAPMGPIAEYSDDEYHMQMAEEFRNDNHYGHLNLLNIKELIQPVATGPGSGGPADAIDYPINHTIIEETRRQGGISIEAHNLGPFHSSGVAVNVIQGYSDSLDQLEPRHYYNFLNAGVRIGLSNGSDHPARLAGICRVYVHAPGPLDYDTWCRRLAEGRTFTTSGPLLLLTVNDANVGDTLDVAEGDSIKVSVKAWSRFPLGRVEIVSNGEVMESIRTQSSQTTTTINILADQPRWFVARASRNDSFDALSGADIAHTSAIYMNMGNKGVFMCGAAQGWIDNAQQHRRRLIERGNFENDAQREEALAHIDAGIACYQELIDAHHAALAEGQE